MHEQAMCLVNEDRVLEFFEAFRTFFGQESGEFIQDYINIQTKEDQRTALQLAIQNNRPVALT